MPPRRILALFLLLALAAVAAAIAWRERIAPATSGVAPVRLWTPVAATSLDHGRFKHLAVYAPNGSPRGFVLLLSGAAGWDAAMAAMARQLAAQGAMVAGIDLPQLEASLEADGAQCVYPDGDLENLSHFVQAYYHLPSYLSPILAGYSAGAALAYASLAQAPASTFAAAVSMNFCPAFGLHKPLCRGSGLEFTPHNADAGVDFLPSTQIRNSWVVLQGIQPEGEHLGEAADESGACSAAAIAAFVARVPHAQLIPEPKGPSQERAPGPAPAQTPAGWSPAQAAAFDALLAKNAATAAAPAPDALKDLPLIEIPALSGAAQSGNAPTDTFAIMLSGDGGWAGLDKEVAGALSADGIPVVGLDSLRYFWSARTPQGLAADVGRIIAYYSTQLRKQRVMLIGYSQGADVLPFAVNRVTAAARAQVGLAAIMGMSEHALFEFHVSSWLADDNSGPATLPEVERITGIPVLCIYGEDENDSLCPQLDPRKVTVVKLKGGHHFDGDYAGLAQTILASLRH